MAAAKKKASTIDQRDQVREIMAYYRKYGPANEGDLVKEKQMSFLSE